MGPWQTWSVFLLCAGKLSCFQSDGRPAEPFPRASQSPVCSGLLCHCHSSLSQLQNQIRIDSVRSDSVPLSHQMQTNGGEQSVSESVCEMGHRKNKKLDRNKKETGQHQGLQLLMAHGQLSPYKPARKIQESDRTPTKHLAVGGETGWLRIRRLQIKKKWKYKHTLK